MKNLLVILFFGVLQVGLGQNSHELEKAINLIEKEDFIKSLKILNQVISADSSNSTAFTNRAKCFMKRGEYQKALSDLEFSLKLDRNNANTYCGLGSVYALTQKYALSILNFNKTLEIDNNHVDSYNSRGALKFYFLNDSDGAMSDYNKALKLSPKDDYTLYNRGILYNDLEDYDNAYKDLTASLTEKPKQSDAHYARGRASFFLGNYKLALKDYQKTIKYNKPIGPFGRIDNSEVYYFIGLCYQVLNKEKKAKNYFEKAKKLGYE